MTEALEVKNIDPFEQDKQKMKELFLGIHICIVKRNFCMLGKENLEKLSKNNHFYFFERKRTWFFLSDFQK